MENTAPRDGLYGALNKLFSLNFTCLRLSKQDTPKTEARTYSRDEIFGRSSGDRWVSRKLEDISNIRNSLISGLSETIVDQTENIKLIEEELAKAKTALLMVYNIWFEKNKKFEEVFDGFVCKDPEFAEMIHFFETHESFYTEEPAIIQIAQIYSNYIDLQTKSSALKTFQEIAETLFQDFNSYGRPNFYHGKPTNPNILAISKKQIEEFEKEAKGYLSRVEGQARAVNKKALMLQRKLKSKRLQGPEREAVEQEHAVEILNLRNLNMIYNIATELVDFANQFKLRIEAANNDLNPTWLGNFCEGLVDFLTGATSVERPVLDSVYAHKSEFNYIKYLKMLLKDFASPESVKQANERPTEIKKFE